MGDKEMGKLHDLQNKKSMLKKVKCIKLGGKRLLCWNQWQT